MPTIINEKIVSLSLAEVEEISSRSIREHDKWYRMCAGIASNLERYENGIIYLRIDTTEKNGPSDYDLAVKFVGYWMQWNKELADSQGFVVSFYKTQATGFLVSGASILRDDNMISAIAEQMKSTIKEERKLINIFSGVLTAKIT